MDDHQFDDLKQFITVTVFQSEARRKNELASKTGLDKLEKKVDNLRDEMLDGFTGVGDAIQGINDRLDKRDKEVDTRLIKLEQKIA